MLSGLLGRRNRYSKLPNADNDTTIKLGGLHDSIKGKRSGTASTPGDITFSPDEAISHIGFGKFHIQLVVVIGFLWMVEGMEIFVLSVLSPYLRCVWNLTYGQETLLPVLTSLGMMISSSVWGWICDVYGRKNGLYMSCVWFVYFAFLSTFSPHYNWLLALRFLVGIGIGGSAQSITIVAEYTPRKFRGKILVLIPIFWAVGFIFAAILSMWLMVDYGFRVLLGALCIPGLLFILLFWWIPESCRFYTATGQTKKAMEMLSHIARVNGTDLPHGTLKAPPIPVENTGNASKLVKLFRGGYSRLTLTVWLTWFISLMMYYSVVYVTTEFFQRYDNNICTETLDDVLTCQQCKPLSRNDYFDVIWTSIAEVPGILIAIFLVDSLGRKKSMCATALFAAIFQNLLFLCLNRAEATVVLMVMRCALVGYSAIIYLYTAEAYPTSVRATAMGTGYFCGRIGMLIAPFIAEVLFHWSVTATKVFFVVALFFGFLAALSLPFETSDREFV